MKHSSDIFNKTRTLRQEGKSYRDISHLLHIPLSTCHLWTKDIKLTQDQERSLIQKRNETLQKSRHLAASIKHNKKIQNETEITQSAQREFEKLSHNPVFILGVGLYWAEGFKKDHSLGFVNSDPDMLLFFLSWLSSTCNVDRDKIRVRIQINAIYKNDLDRIATYWSNKLNIPIDHFQKPMLLISKQAYSSLDQNYFGMIRIRAIGTRELFVRIQSWIQTLKNSNFGRYSLE